MTWIQIIGRGSLFLNSQYYREKEVDSSKHEGGGTQDRGGVRCSLWETTKGNGEARKLTLKKQRTRGEGRDPRWMTDCRIKRLFRSNNARTPAGKRLKGNSEKKESSKFQVLENDAKRESAFHYGAVHFFPQTIELEGKVPVRNSGSVAF